MKILVLDTRSGDSVSDLFVLDESGARKKRLRLGCVPELHYDSTAGELLVVDTRFRSWLRKRTTYWLKSYDTSTWRSRWKRQTPERPMYTGYPGRSTNVDVSPSGRYVYLLQSRMLIRSMADPEASDTFRLTVHRYDRGNHSLQAGLAVVESCMVAFGHAGSSDDDLYFHLSCDYPSTVAFCRFDSPEVEWVRMVDLPARDHSPRETCGSWLDAARETLYCAAGDGTVHEVTRRPAGSRVLLKLDLAAGEMIPLRQVCGGGGLLFVGISANIGERSLSLASEVCQVSIAKARVIRRLELPFPVLNFVISADGSMLAGVSPYQRAVCLLDAQSGRLLRTIDNIGSTPAEVLLLEQSS